MACFQVALQAQKPAQPAAWTYDVVSIKLEDPNPGSVGIRKLPTGIEAYTVTLQDLIKEAYGLEDVSLIANAPDWKTHYHVVAKLDSDKLATLATLSPEEQLERNRQMLQGLLAEYFHLQVHHGTKPLAVYSLTVDPHGLKVKPVTSAEGTGSADSFIADGRFVAQCSMARLAHFLDVGRQMGIAPSDRPVIDDTGVKGQFQFDLSWDTTTRSEQERNQDAVVYGSLASALIHEAGLRLVPKKIQADAIVVDHAEAPTLD